MFSVKIYIHDGGEYLLYLIKSITITAIFFRIDGVFVIFWPSPI